MAKDPKSAAPAPKAAAAPADNGKPSEASRRAEAPGVATAPDVVGPLVSPSDPQAAREEPGPIPGEPRAFSNSDFDDDGYYRVQLARSVKFGSRWLRPSSALVMQGSAVKAIGVENVLNAAESSSS